MGDSCDDALVRHETFGCTSRDSSICAIRVRRTTTWIEGDQMKTVVRCPLTSGHRFEVEGADDDGRARRAESLCRREDGAA
jgi:hypothetical protein